MESARSKFKETELKKKSRVRLSLEFVRATLQIALA